MKLKVGKKVIPVFEKKKAEPAQRPNFSGINSGFPRTQQLSQNSFLRPQSMGQRPVFKPRPSIYPRIKKEKPKDIAQIIANLPKDELYAWVSIIVGLIFIFIGVFSLL